MFAPFPLDFYLNYKVSTEIQGLSSTDAIFTKKVSILDNECYMTGCMIPYLTKQSECVIG